jgi:hypothetical protein
MDIDNKNTKNEYVSFLLRFFNENKRVKKKIEKMKPKDMSLNIYIIEILKEHIKKVNMMKDKRKFKEIYIKTREDDILKLPLCILVKNVNIRVVSTKLGIHLEKLEKTNRSFIMRILSGRFINKTIRLLPQKPKKFMGGIDDDNNLKVNLLDSKRGIVAVSSLERPIEEIRELWDNLKDEDVLIDVLIEGGNFFFKRYMLYNKATT